MHGIPLPGRGSRRPQLLAARGYPMVEVSLHVTADPVSELAGPLSETDDVDATLAGAAGE
jgi:hypothetical protein